MYLFIPKTRLLRKVVVFKSVSVGQIGLLSSRHRYLNIHEGVNFPLASLPALSDIWKYSRRSVQKLLNLFISLPPQHRSQASRIPASTSNLRYSEERGDGSSMRSSWTNFGILPCISKHSMKKPASSQQLKLPSWCYRTSVVHLECFYKSIRPLGIQFPSAMSRCSLLYLHLKFL